MTLSGNLTLDWHGPHRFSEFVSNSRLRDQFNTPGVYLWIETSPSGGKQLSYVGRAISRSLSRRQLEHYANQIGGLYTIPEEFRASEREWMPNWEKPEASILLNQGEFIKVVHDGFQYANAVEIYLCPMPSEMDIKADDIKAVERNLLFDLRPIRTKPGTKTEPKRKLFIQHRNPGWLAPEIREHIKNDLLFV